MLYDPKWEVKTEPTEEWRLIYVAATRAKLTVDLTECPPFCGGQDGRDTGNAETAGAWVPGLRITYTVPMPTEEEQAARLAAKAAPQAPAEAPAVAQPAPRPAAGSGNGPEWTWAKVGEKWGVRGPADVATGSRVKVMRRDGSTSTVTLREVVQKYGSTWVYGV